MNAHHNFEVVLPSGMYQEIREFLFADPSREYMGVILAGFSRVGGSVKLLGREFIRAEQADLVRQSRVCIEARQAFSKSLMQRCAKEHLCQLDCHSHPFGASPQLEFSQVDDRFERHLAAYIHQHLPNTYYGSLVFNQGFIRGRMWLEDGRGVTAHPIQHLTALDFPVRRLAIGGQRLDHNGSTESEAALDRQVRAFGSDGQKRLSELTLCVVGAGGLGSILIEDLVRLGVGGLNIIDPDLSEPSNLNRVTGMTFDDATHSRPKAQIAARLAQEISPRIRVQYFIESVFERRMLNVLKSSDAILVATDNHSTRVYVQLIGVQYLTPVVSIGVSIEVEEDVITDISGEYAIALPGADGWCLNCAHAVDPTIMAWELASTREQARWVSRGYVTGAEIPSPSVRHLNGVTASLASAEVHNLFTGFKKPQRYVAYDQLKMELLPITISRDPSCAVCSPNALLGLGDLQTLPDYQRRVTEIPRALKANTRRRLARNTVATNKRSGAKINRRRPGTSESRHGH